MHWKVWMLLATLAWAAWGTSVKYALGRIEWQKIEILSAIAALAMMAFISPVSFALKPDTRHLLGFVAGGLGATGAILFYIALSKGPVSVIIPVTSLYIVGVAAAGIILFGEPLTFKKALGVILAVTAIILLAGEK